MNQGKSEQVGASTKVSSSSFFNSIKRTSQAPRAMQGKWVLQSKEMLMQIQTTVETVNSCTGKIFKTFAHSNCFWGPFMHRKKPERFVQQCSWLSFNFLNTIFYKSHCNSISMSSLLFQELHGCCFLKGVKGSAAAHHASYSGVCKHRNCPRMVQLCQALRLGLITVALRPWNHSPLGESRSNHYQPLWQNQAETSFCSRTPDK